MPAFNDYLPEELEPRTRELASWLEALHQQPGALDQIAPSEQERIVARARQRLFTPGFTTSSANAQETLPLLRIIDTPEFHAQRPAPVSTRRKSGIVRMLNAIAAVLVIGAIITASVVLFAHHPSSSIGHPPATASTAIAGPQAPIQNPLPCFLGDQADSGLVGVCQQHLYQDLNITSQQGKYLVVLTRAYADANRVAVSLRLDELVHGQYVPGTSSVMNLLDLKDAQGQSFPFLLGTGQATSTDNQFVSWYAVPSGLAIPDTLHLHLNVQVSPQPPHKGNGPSHFITPANEIVTIGLDFSVTTHPELRTIPINQTVIVDGVPMTLKQMRISPSEVLFDASYSQRLPREAYASISSELRVGTADCTNANGANGAGDGNYAPDIYQHGNWPQLTGPDTVIVLGCPLYTAHGTAHLVLTLITTTTDANNRINTKERIVGTFTFTIPAQ